MIIDMDSVINDEAGLEKLRSSDPETQESTSPPETASQIPSGPTALEQELAKALSDLIPPVYDRTHPCAGPWDAARALIAKVKV